MTSSPAIPAPTLATNIVKTRNDRRPIELEHQVGSTAAQPKLKLKEGTTCSWAKPDEEIGPDRLRPRVEPWLTALSQSEHLSVLLGSGLTQAVHQMATGSALRGMASADFGEFNTIIDAESARSSRAADRATPNIEDQIRAANELLRGLEILGLEDHASRGNANTLGTKLEEVLLQFADSVLVGEQNLLKASSGNRETAFNYLVSFLMSFASRSGTRDRLNLFTTNYDRFIEAGAEVAGMHLLDRFVGSLAPVFRSSRLDLDLHYNPPGIRGEPRYLEGVARITKLHGSLDWVSHGRDIRRIGLPFGAPNISPYLGPDGTPEGSSTRLMIYPNPAKDRETAAYPYVELFRDFAAATCRPNHTLITFGYSFGDEHINRVIEDMLTIPSTHIVVISYDDPLHRIVSTYERLGRQAQVSMLIGDHVGAFRTLVEDYLPKPAIDRTTFRMTELLKSRWNEPKQGDDIQHEIGAPAEGLPPMDVESG